MATSEIREGPTSVDTSEEQEDEAMPEVTYTLEDRIARITLNAPARGNKFTPSMRAELNEALRRYKDDDEAWMAVIGAEGKDFSLGSDDSPPATYAARRERNDNYAGGYVEMWKPTIAAIQGECRGEGLAVALSCDLRVADDTATFTADWNGAPGEPNVLGVYLVTLSGLSTAMELMWLNRTLDVKGAFNVGLLNRTVVAGPLPPPDADEGRFPMLPMLDTITVPNGDAQSAGIAYAKEMLQYAPVTRTFQKVTAVRSVGIPFFYAQTLLLGPDPYASADRLEGNRAFAENRRPVWKNR
jgi:enoyl-CoA hydratase/carnithine racemase